MEKHKVVGGGLAQGFLMLPKAVLPFLPFYFFSLIINDGCFKLRNSAGKIQFSPGPCREGIKKSSVSKGLVLL